VGLYGVGQQIGEGPCKHDSEVFIGTVHDLYSLPNIVRVVK
jgi:hypothetical protein